MLIILIKSLNYFSKYCNNGHNILYLKYITCTQCVQYVKHYMHYGSRYKYSLYIGNVQSLIIIHYL